MTPTLIPRTISDHNENIGSVVLPQSEFLELVRALITSVPIFFGRGTCGTGVYCDLQDAHATLETMFAEGSKEWTKINDLNKIAMGEDQKIVCARPIHTTIYKYYIIYIIYI